MKRLAAIFLMAVCVLSVSMAQADSRSAAKPVNKVYLAPKAKVNKTGLAIVSVTIDDRQTVMTVVDANHEGYRWYDIDKNACIMADGMKYTLTGAQNITIAPEQTFYSFPGEIKTFLLYFPAIPENTKSIDFFESEEGWKISGIQLKKSVK